MYNVFLPQQGPDGQLKIPPSITHIEKFIAGRAAEAHADLSAIDEHMARLSREHRQILILICAKGMRYEEASELLQIPVSAVRTRLARARQQLSGLLAPHRKDLFPHPPHATGPEKHQPLS